MAQFQNTEQVVLGRIRKSPGNECLGHPCRTHSPHSPVSYLSSRGLFVDPENVSEMNLVAARKKIETKKHASSRSLTTIIPYVKAIVVKGRLAGWSGGPLPLLTRDVTRTLSLTRNRVLSRPIYWMTFGGD